MVNLFLERHIDIKREVRYEVLGFREKLIPRILQSGVGRR